MDSCKACVAVVDPLSTGGCIAVEAARRGLAVIAVWSRDLTPEARALVPPECEGMTYFAEVGECPTIAETAEAVRQAARQHELVACIVGAELGVELADRLSQELGLRTNGLLEVGSRRDKGIQQDCLRSAGLRAARGASGTAWHQVQQFVDTEPFPVVLKPTGSGGSDGVKLCLTKEEAEEHFHLLMNTPRKAGCQGDPVLVQEYLRGKEFIVDHVTLDGVHKTVNLCVCDKKPTNGSEFVYYGIAPLEDWDSGAAQALISYVRAALDAIGFKNGPSHGEVIMTADGPCLVEMNCRACGNDGAFAVLQRSLFGGYSQVEATLDAFVDEAAFERLPSVPRSPFKMSGYLVYLVSWHAGEVTATPGYEQIQGLPSFASLRCCPKIGEHVEITTDLFTCAGVIVLTHADPEAVANDIRAIRAMEDEGALFTFAEGAGDSSQHVEEVVMKKLSSCADRRSRPRRDSHCEH